MPKAKLSEREKKNRDKAFGIFDESDPGEWPEVQKHTKRARQREGKPILLRWHKDRFLHYDHLKAAGQIRRAYELMTEDIKPAQLSLIRTIGKGMRQMADWNPDQIDCVDLYLAWYEAMIAAGIPCGPVLDIIIDEKPVDKRTAGGAKYYRVKDNVKRGLSLYCKLKAERLAKNK